VHTARARVSSPIQHWRARRQGRWQYPGPRHMPGAACMPLTSESSPSPPRPGSGAHVHLKNI
jgi:hypothetical protein